MCARSRTATSPSGGRGTLPRMGLLEIILIVLLVVILLGGIGYRRW